MAPEETEARAATLSRRGPTVACRYIDRPLLMNGLKFDLRLYVLVMSGWSVGSVFSEGLVRFACVFLAVLSRHEHPTPNPHPDPIIRALAL